MKLRILEILDFKEKASAKKPLQSIVYAVYTPQEMMKSVLAQDVDKKA
jgi:hypothetical protein